MFNIEYVLYLVTQISNSQTADVFIQYTEYGWILSNVHNITYLFFYFKYIYTG